MVIRCSKRSDRLSDDLTLLLVFMSIKKSGLIIVFLLSSSLIKAQCAMCRAVVEQGGEETAEGINSGIVYLMAFPYLIIAISIFLFYRNWKKNNS